MKLLLEEVQSAQIIVGTPTSTLPRWGRYLGIGIVVVLLLQVIHVLHHDPSLPTDHSNFNLPALPVPPVPVLDPTTALLSAQRQLSFAQQRRTLEAQQSMSHHASLLHALRRRDVIPPSVSGHGRLVKRSAEPKGARHRAKEESKEVSAPKAPKPDKNAWRANMYAAPLSLR